jgi:hypothetical protein
MAAVTTVRLNPNETTTTRFAKKAAMKGDAVRDAQREPLRPVLFDEFVGTACKMRGARQVPLQKQLPSPDSLSHGYMMSCL